MQAISYGTQSDKHPSWSFVRKFQTPLLSSLSYQTGARRKKKKKGFEKTLQRTVLASKKNPGSRSRVRGLMAGLERIRTCMLPIAKQCPVLLFFFLSPFPCHPGGIQCEGSTQGGQGLCCLFFPGEAHSHRAGFCFSPFPQVPSTKSSGSLGFKDDRSSRTSSGHHSWWNFKAVYSSFLLLYGPALLSADLLNLYDILLLRYAYAISCRSMEVI